MIANSGKRADTFFSRMKGLLGRDGLAPQEALVITQCHSVHMFFMRFAIDVIFVDRRHRVVGVVENIQPFCLSPIFFSSSYVIEANPGTAAASGTVPGDLVEILDA